MQWQVYALIDPRTQKIRYVGWTSHTVPFRIRRHRGEALRKAPNGTWLHQHYRARWIRQLLRLEKWPPEYSILESGTGFAWAEAERRWIRELKERGENLVNGTLGGESGYGRKLTTDARETARLRAKVQNLSGIQAERWRDPEYRNRLLTALNTPEARMRRQQISRQLLQNNPTFVARLRKLCAIGRAEHWAVPENRQMASEVAKASHINRLAKGLGPCNHRLTEADVRQIREKAQTGTKGFIQDMAKAYNVAYMTMYKVVHGMTWKHIPGAIRPNTSLRRTRAPDLQAQYTAPAQHSPTAPTLVGQQPQPTTSRTATP